MRLAFLRWTDDDVASLMDTLEVVEAPRMHSLHLDGNFLTERSIQRLCATLRRGHLPGCRFVKLLPRVIVVDDEIQGTEEMSEELMEELRVVLAGR